MFSWASLVVQSVKNSPAVQKTACNTGDVGSVPGLGGSPGEGNGNISNILAWEIPWTEEPGRLPAMGSRKSWI